MPTPEARSGGAYEKLERKVGDYATAGVAAYIVLGEDGTCRRAGLGLTNVGLVPIKATAAEAHLHGTRLDDDALGGAADRAAAAADPGADLRGSVEYKRAMVRELTGRALRRAVQRARG